MGCRMVDLGVGVGVGWVYGLFAHVYGSRSAAWMIPSDQVFAYEDALGDRRW